MAQFSYSGKKIRKAKLLMLILGIWANGSWAQNVGIGNTNPAYKLDLSGRMRIRGGIDNNFTAGMYLGGLGADSATNKMFLGMESDSTAGLFSELNGMGWFLVANGWDGRLGIRNRSPKFPLSFGDEAGDKISLYRDANGNYYGLGVGNAAMQLMTPSSASNILFGYGKSYSFIENMRLTGTGELVIGATAANQAGLTVNKRTGAVNALFGSNTSGVAIESFYPGIGFNSYYNGGRKTISTGYSGYIGVNAQLGGMQFLVSPQSNNTDVFGAYKIALDIKPDGKVGIGVSDPAYILDIAERMRIRSAPGGFTAGLWLSNNANNASPAFIGMQNDNQVGLYGTGTGFGLLMNTQTGAISFNGNAGQPGQVLTSNGTSGAPVWKDNANTMNEAYLTSGVSLVNGSDFVDIPGLAANFTLTAPSSVVFHFRVRIFTNSCVACANNQPSFILQQNVLGGTQNVIQLDTNVPENRALDYSSGPMVIANLAPGTYSYKLVAKTSGPGNAFVSVGNGYSQSLLTWQIFPN